MGERDKVIHASQLITWVKIEIKKLGSVISVREKCADEYYCSMLIGKVSPWICVL